jgi:hypothetical protein
MWRFPAIAWRSNVLDHEAGEIEKRRYNEQSHRDEKYYQGSIEGISALGFLGKEAEIL